MAKLSARGRTEVVRLERIQNPAPPAFPGDDTLTRRTLFAVMSDGRILTRQEWTAPGYGAPRSADAAISMPCGPTLKTGWRVHARIKDCAHPVNGPAHRARWLAVKLAQGFKVVGSPAIEIPPPAVRP